MSRSAEVETGGNALVFGRDDFARHAQGRGESPLSLSVPDELVERIAERAAAIVLARLQHPAMSASPYLTVGEAAEYLRAKRQRVYDLLSARRLTRYKDGSRVLVARAELDAYFAGSGSRRIDPALSPTRQSRLPKGLAA